MTGNDHLALLSGALEQDGTSRDPADALELAAGPCRPEEGRLGCSGCLEIGFCRRDPHQENGQNVLPACG